MTEMQLITYSILSELQDDDCRSDCKTESSQPPSGYCTNECDDSLSDTGSDSELKEEDTSDTNDSDDSEGATQNINNPTLNSVDSKTEDDDTDIEAVVFEYYHNGSEPPTTISTIKGTHNMIKNGRSPPHFLSTPVIASSSASTDDEVSPISPAAANDGVPANYILDSNFTSIFLNTEQVG